MAKILLIEEPDSDVAVSLAHLIETSGDYTCTRVASDELFESKLLAESAYDAAVLSKDFLGQPEFASVMKLSALTEDMPVLIVAGQIGLESYRKIDRLKNTVAIQKGFQPEVFRGMLERICRRVDYKPEICPRFVTNEEIRVMLVDSGIMINSRMRNYSAGGLFIEYRGISLQVGDRVQVNLACPSETRDNLQFQARVVWERKFEDIRSPARGVGLQFI